jgi:hypothetical protein
MLRGNKYKKLWEKAEKILAGKIHVDEEERINIVADLLADYKWAVSNGILASEDADQHAKFFDDLAGIK